MPTQSMLAGTHLFASMLSTTLQMWSLWMFFINVSLKPSSEPEGRCSKVFSGREYSLHKMILSLRDKKGKKQAPHLRRWPGGPCTQVCIQWRGWSGHRLLRCNVNLLWCPTWLRDAGNQKAWSYQGCFMVFRILEAQCTTFVHWWTAGGFP